MKLVAIVSFVALAAATCAANELELVLTKLQRKGALSIVTLNQLKQLGPAYNQNDLNVKQVLEQVEDIAVRKCSQEQLNERNFKLTMFMRDSGQYQAVIDLLNDAMKRQVKVCLQDANENLEKRTLGKLRKSSRDDLELFHEYVQDFSRPERGIDDLDEVVAVATNKFMMQKAAKKQTSSLAGKLANTMTRKVTSKRYRRAQALVGLKETCQLMRDNLDQLSQLVNVGQGLRLHSDLTPQLVKWAQVRKYCVELLGNKSPELVGLQKFINEKSDSDFDYDDDDDQD